MEKGIAKRGIDDIGRVVLQHLRKVFVKYLPVDLLEAYHVRFGEFCSVPLIEGSAKQFDRAEELMAGLEESHLAAATISV